MRTSRPWRCGPTRRKAARTTDELSTRQPPAFPVCAPARLYAKFVPMSQHPSAPVEISPTMRELSAYIATALKHPLPPAIVERAKIHLVDTFAAMLSGSRLTPGKRAVAYVKSLGGKPEAGV